MIKINIICSNKAWLRYIKNPNKFIENKLTNFNKKFTSYKKNTIFLTILLSGDKEIKKLNNKFRKKNKTTDVLSFPFYKKEDLKKRIIKEKEIYLGDIIINLNKLKNKDSKTNLRLELDKLWIHGLVHLLGYDHKKNQDFNKMKRVEKKFLSYLNK